MVRLCPRSCRCKVAGHSLSRVVSRPSPRSIGTTGLRPKAAIRRPAVSEDQPVRRGLIPGLVQISGRRVSQFHVAGNAELRRSVRSPLRPDLAGDTRQINPIGHRLALDPRLPISRYPIHLWSRIRLLQSSHEADFAPSIQCLGWLRPSSPIDPLRRGNPVFRAC